jgi:hypothetical protein
MTTKSGIIGIKNFKNVDIGKDDYPSEINELDDD